MNRRHFITTAAMAIPTLTMGLSLKPNIPEIIDTNFIWDKIYPKIPNLNKYCVVIGYRLYGELYYKEYREYEKVYCIYQKSKEDLLNIESEKGFVEWQGMYWSKWDINSREIINIFFKREYLDRYNEAVKMNEKKYEIYGRLNRINIVLEDWV
jgi:hypothetical protein